MSLILMLRLIYVNDFNGCDSLSRKIELGTTKNILVSSGRMRMQ